MPTSGASLSSYLRHQNLHFANQREYNVSPRVDLICFQAYHLAQMNAQPLHPLTLLKAMLHIPGSAVERLLTQNGLTLEKIHATPPDPQDPPLDVGRFFRRVLTFTQGGPSITSWHLLLAVLDEESMKPYFAAWHVNPDALRTAALALNALKDDDQ